MKHPQGRPHRARFGSTAIGVCLGIGLIACSNPDADVDDGADTTVEDTSGGPVDAGTKDVGTATHGLPHATSMFQLHGIHTISLKTSAASWKTFLANAADKTLERTYHKADVTIDGVDYKGVGIKNFGDGSQQGNPKKPNVRIKFNIFDDTLKGPTKLRNMRLKAAGSDPTFIREPLFYAMLREIKVAAPRTSWARVTINGETYGLYQVIEQADKRFFKHNFGNTKGWNYDVGSSCHGLNCPKGDCAKIVNYYEIEHDLAPGEKPDFTPIVQLVTAIAKAPDNELEGKLAKLVDLDNLLGTYAMEAMASDHDGLSAGGANFEIYRDETTKLMHVIRNGTDGSFKNIYKLEKPWGLPNTWCQGREDHFYKRALKHPTLSKKLDKRLRDLQCGPFAKSWYVPWLEALRKPLSEELARPGEKSQFLAADLSGHMNKLVTYLVGRAKTAEARLGKCPK